MADAAVIAVPAEEEGGEDEIKAVVVAAPGAALDAAMVWAWCDEMLPYFAVPRYVEILPELPKTPTAKILKSELREAGVTPGTSDRGAAPRRWPPVAGLRSRRERPRLPPRRRRPLPE